MDECRQFLSMKNIQWMICGDTLLQYHKNQFVQKPYNICTFSDPRSFIGDLSRYIKRVAIQTGDGKVYVGSELIIHYMERDEDHFILNNIIFDKVEILPLRNIKIKNKNCFGPYLKKAVLEVMYGYVGPNSILINGRYYCTEKQKQLNLFRSKLGLQSYIDVYSKHPFCQSVRSHCKIFKKDFYVHIEYNKLVEITMYFWTERIKRKVDIPYQCVHSQDPLDEVLDEMAKSFVYSLNGE